MSVGPIYRFSGEFAWASNFDETELHLEPDPTISNVMVPTTPAWNTPEGHAQIVKITASTEGLKPRVVEEGTLRVPGVERPFQAWKTDDVKAAAYMLGASSPAAAKRFGQPMDKGGIVADLRPGWATGVAQSAMLYLTRLKYNSDDMHLKLGSTGYRLLVEGNNWDDTIWGAVWGQTPLEGAPMPPCWGRNNAGQELRGWNWLGRILNLVRAEHHVGMGWV